MAQAEQELLEKLAELELEQDVLKLQLLNLGFHKLITPSEYNSYFDKNKRLIEDIKRRINLFDS